MTCEVALTKGYVAIIDAADHDLIDGLSWHASVEGGRVYAKARVPGEDRYVKLHRLIMGEPPAVVDHRDGNTLDCRRSNLRICTRIENGRNAQRRADSTCPFKGVERRGNVWRARIRSHGAHRSLGHYPTAEAAARAYDHAAREAFGEFACVNFPAPDERSAARRLG